MNNDAPDICNHDSNLLQPLPLIVCPNLNGCVGLFKLVGPVEAVPNDSAEEHWMVRVVWVVVEWDCCGEAGRRVSMSWTLNVGNDISEHWPEVWETASCWVTRNKYSQKKGISYTVKDKHYHQYKMANWSTCACWPGAAYWAAMQVIKTGH